MEQRLGILHKSQNYGSDVHFLLSRLSLECPSLNSWLPSVQPQREGLGDWEPRKLDRELGRVEWEPGLRSSEAKRLSSLSCFLVP